jgi:probable F420-dependent oxidoreductase
MEFDCYSFGVPMREVTRLARSAETIGFSGLWFTESSHNPLLLSATAGLATETLTVGSGIAVAFARSPMATAQAAWDVAQAAQGRFVLGLGSQVKAHIERRFSMPWTDKPAAQMREYIEAVRSAFACFQGSAPLRFEGDFYRLSLMTDFFNSGPSAYPEVPIYLSAVNPLMARVAGAVADGVHVHPVHSTRYLREVLRPAVERGASEAGRTMRDVALAVPVFVIVGDSEPEFEEQRESVRQQLAFYGSTPAYRRVFELHEWGDLAQRLSQLQRERRPDEMAALITDDVLDTFSVSAPWGELAARLIERYEGLADRVFPYGTAGDWLARPALAERWSAVARAVRSA